MVYSLILSGYCRKKYNYDKTWTIENNMLVVETTDNHKSACFNVSRNELMKGRDDFNRLISEVAYYEMFGYDNEVEFI